MTKKGQEPVSSSDDALAAYIAGGGSIERLEPGERSQPVYRSMRQLHSESIKLAKLEARIKERI